jgi:hypothetical protein
MERREAPAFLKRERGYCKTGAPLGAPSPRFIEGQKKGPRERAKVTAYPGPVKNAGDDACLNETSLFEI